MSEPAWLEVSLTVDGELAEAVAEVMARYIATGIVIESTQITDQPAGPGIPEGPLRVCGYLPVDDSLEDSRQQLEQALGYLGQISSLPSPSYQDIHEVNWMETWKQHYHPIEVGERLLILPAWIPQPSTQRLTIRIDPGMAFGTGAHPTTQLALQLIEEYAQPGGALIDVGCGSGILSIAAALLGAAPILAVDVDSKAIPLARQQAADNHLPSAIEFGAGSVTEILGGNFSIQQAPVVIANILAPILVRLLNDGLAQLVAPQGLLLLSGILDESEPELIAALHAQKMSVLNRRVSGDWVALVAGVQ
ncbi:MAG: 50S ribosomal protein L11 methyltransferase [Anaerolineae bacterium]|nr:50S ribosomal protein L11 methyltransferase [Anaerolineae bacterium]